MGHSYDIFDLALLLFSGNMTATVHYARLAPTAERVNVMTAERAVREMKCRYTT